MNNKTHVSYFLLIPSFFFLFGCATPRKPTPYQRISDMGGYDDMQMDNNTLRVGFWGNTSISKEMDETYLLYRCTEEKESGYTVPGNILQMEGGSAFYTPPNRVAWTS